MEPVSNPEKTIFDLRTEAAEPPLEPPGTCHQTRDCVGKDRRFSGRAIANSSILSFPRTA